MNKEIAYKISNNSGNKVVALLASVSGKEARSKQFYDQPFMLLSSTSGNYYIENSTASTFLVKAVDEQKLYTLILALKDNYFPVRIIPVDFDSANTEEIDLVTNDLKQYQLAESFAQSILALPSSEIADNYAKALSSKSPEVITNFFKSKENYQQLTVDHVVAIQSYYNRFPYLWKNYSPVKQYQIVKVTDTGNEPAGTLTLSSAKAEDNLPVTPGTETEVHYQPVQPNAKPILLQYNNGKFLSARGESPSVNLQGQLSLKDQISGSGADKPMETVLTGSVDDQNVVGEDSKDNKNDESWISINGLTHPDEVKDWLQLTAIVGGAFGLLLILGAAAVFIVRRSRAGAESKEYTYDSDPDSDFDEGLDAVAADWEALNLKAKTIMLKNSRIKAIVVVEEQIKFLKKIAEISSNDELMSAADELFEVRQNLVDMPLSGNRIELKTCIDKLGKTSRLLQDQFTALESQQGQTLADDFKTSAETIETGTNDLVERNKFIEDCEDQNFFNGSEMKFRSEIIAE